MVDSDWMCTEDVFDRVCDVTVKECLMSEKAVEDVESTFEVLKIYS